MLRERFLFNTLTLLLSLFFLWEATGLAAVVPPTATAAIRIKVTGPNIPAVTKVFPGLQAGKLEAYAGSKLIVDVQALDASNNLIYEGFITNLTLTAGQVAGLSGPAMSPPVVKSEEAGCLSCHQNTLDTTGQGIVPQYKQSGHYLNTSFTGSPKNGATLAGCAGCHGTSHNDSNPSASGRCFECHGTSLNPQHTGSGNTSGKYLNDSNNNCSSCHNPHWPMSPDATAATTFPTTGDIILSTLRDLTITSVGTGSGTITANSGSVAWSDKVGSASYGVGTQVTLTAAANSDNFFSGWTGCDSTNGNDCRVNMDSSKSVAATFSLPHAVTSSAALGGTIAPNAIQNVNHGDTAAFTITPQAGYSVATPIGGSCPQGTLNGSNYTTGPITADCSVAADFILRSFAISAASGGNGTISCNPTTVSYGGSTACTLHPDNGYRLASFTDNGVDHKDAASAGNYSILNVVDNHSLNAGFEPIPDTAPPAIGITAPRNNSSSSILWEIDGTAGDNIGVTKVEIQIYNGIRYLSAAGSFTTAPTWIPATSTDSWQHWTLDTSNFSLNNIDGTYSITARATDNSNNVATAAVTFNRSASNNASATLLVNKSPASAGSISSNPDGLACDTSCSSTANSYAIGSSIVLTASPRPGYYLAGWSGCDSTAGSTCTISARSGLGAITASFSHQLPTTLNAGPPVTSIKQNATVTLSGVLSTIPAGTGSYLNAKNISIAITKPDGTVVTPAYTTATTDSSGSWSLQLPAVFTAPGAYLATASFAGSTELIATAAATATILMDKSAGYAIVVTGKRSDNSLLDLHSTSTDAIVATLKKRGFLDANINYLKSTTTTTTSRAQVQNALIGWAKDKLAASAAPLYLIMVDHGSPNGFVLGEETLTANDLSGWLTTLEADPSVTSAISSYQRIVVIGSCYSGQFVPALSKGGRVVITSAGADEESIAGVKMWDINSNSYLTGGEYFMDSLFSFLGRGDTLKDAFMAASGALPARDVRRLTNGTFHYGVFDNLEQHPLLDDNGDGTASYQLNGSDGQIASTLKLGEGITTNASGNPADIQAVTPQTSLENSVTSSPIWLQANLDARVGTAWAEIRTPDTTATGAGSGGQVLIDLSTETLTHNAAAGRWEATWKGFTTAGRYDIFFYTTDIQTGEQSSPVQTTIYKNRTDNTPPSPFDLLTPGDQATPAQTFSATWQESSDADGLSYTLQIATDQAFANVVYSEQDIPQAFTIIPDTALKNPAVPGSYLCQNGDNYCYWRVQAIDGFGATTTSSSGRSFTIVMPNGLPAFLYGYVRDSTTGAPIGGAQIRVGNSSATTLANGAYLTSIATGSFSLTASASGYQSKILSNLVATSGKTLSATIRLSASGVRQPGDCSGDGFVSIAEVQSAISMFLGLKPVLSCVDQAGLGGVTTAGVQKVVNSFLGW